MKKISTIAFLTIIIIIMTLLILSDNAKGSSFVRKC